MRSRWSIALIALVLGSGCGILGNKQRATAPVIYSADSIGCLNRLGDQARRYLNGTISEGEWAEVWDCTTRSLDTLDELMVGGPGLQTSDLQTLVTQVLITNRPVSVKLVPALLKLKAAVIGGTETLVTREELAWARAIVLTVRDRSLRLLPELRGKKSPKAGLALMDEVQETLKLINQSFPQSTLLSISRDTIEVLVAEIQGILGGSALGNLTDLLLLGKAVLVGGSPDEIEARAWAGALDLVAELASALVAYQHVDISLATAPGEVADYYLSLGERASGALKESVRRHGGAIPLDLLDRLIDAGPDGITVFTKPTIKKVLDSVTRRIFVSRAPRALDESFLNSAVATLRSWQRRQKALEEIYTYGGLSPLGATQEEFLAAAEQYVAGLGSAYPEEVGRLKDLARGIKALFPQDDGEIIQGAAVKYSLWGQGLVQAIDLFGALVIDRYSTAPGRDRLALSDVKEFVEDFKKLSIDRGTLDPTVAHYPERRFREADSYGPVADGNGSVDLHELTYYAVYIYSIEALTIRFRGLVENQCRIDESWDSMKWHPMDAKCFRRIYFGNVDLFWSHMPRLLAYYRALDSAGREKLEQTIENGARQGGYSDAPVGGYDSQSFAAVVHFEEAYFDRYDANRDGRIQTDEALAAAVTHRRIIAEIGGLKPDQTSVLDAIYTYGVKKGRAPRKDVLGTVDFLAWLASKPFWHIDASATDIFQVIPLINIFE